MPMMGWPGDTKVAGNNLNCMHLFNDVGGGLDGTDSSRTIKNVYDSFVKTCKWKVSPVEAPACPAYAEVMVAAVAPNLDKPSIGDASTVCTLEYFFVAAYKQAEVDLKFTLAALPKTSSLLDAPGRNRFGSGGVGPNSDRGRMWAQVAWSRHGPTSGDNTAVESVEGIQPLAQPQSGSSFVQWTEAVWGNRSGKPLLPGADSDEESPRGLPRYYPNPPAQSESQNIVAQSQTMYQLLPGSPDGVLPPVEAPGDLMNYCIDQMSEIMLGFSQTAKTIVEQTRGWCHWQASVTSWVGAKEEYGHPDWDFRRCNGMEQFMAFNLRNELKTGSTAGIAPQQVCVKILLSTNLVHRVDNMIKEAWAVSLRSAPTSAGSLPSAQDAEMKKLMQASQDAADALYSKLRQRKKAFDDMTAAKMDSAAFDPDKIEARGASLLAVGNTHLRSSDFATMSEPPLQQWGSGSA